MNECPRFLQNPARRGAATGFVKNALVPGNMPALVIDVSHSLSGRYWCCGERITHVRLKLRVFVIVLRCVQITLIYVCIVLCLFITEISPRNLSYNNSNYSVLQTSNLS